jgi:translation initiation factor IF-2
MASTIELEDTITVGDLADKLTLPVTNLITELMKMGVMVTVNERIDFETAQIIVQELGLDIDLEKHDSESLVFERRKTKIDGHKTIPRPPVVAVMGHVDHGKTSLLDAIKDSSVVAGEAGGITQHISAYQVTHNGRLITLLDTPGHEAFAALREHGAQLTDLVVIVVAADDGVKPQTIEAIRFAKKAGVKIIVAINKIDKESADTNRVKQQLAEQNVMIEGWGGDVVAVEVSAKAKTGINELLDMILLVADVEELEAYSDIPAFGLVIESHMEKGRGPVAEVLVQGGTLKAGDFIVAGSTYARIRNLQATDGKIIDDAPPSSPVIISGFKSLPSFGDEFNVVKDEKTARNESLSTEMKRQKNKGTLDMNSTELLRIISHNNKISEFNIIIKADVQGSLVSVIDSLKTINTDEVAVRIVGSGIGVINENDIHLAQGSNAIIYGFNVTMPKNIQQLANRSDVKVRLFEVIYELIDDAKEELSELLEPEIVEKDLGTLIIKGIFKQTKTSVICGGDVTKGKLTAPSLAKVKRGKELIAEAEVINLKQGPQDVSEVLEGDTCGMSLKTLNKIDLQIGDKLEVYTRELVERKI